MTESPRQKTADPSDEELMARYVQQGDRRAFEQIFKRYEGRMMALFLRSIRSRSDAQDMVQQTFLHVHRARADFRLDATFRPWVYTIGMNVRREYFRRRQRKPEVSLDPIVHGEPAVAPQTTSVRDRLVRRALMTLSDAQREVVVLHWYEGLTFPEVGEIVGASTTAVKVRAHRAYKRLRMILSEDSE